MALLAGLPQREARITADQADLREPGTESRNGWQSRSESGTSA